jgi:hypothetical protein
LHLSGYPIADYLLIPLTANPSITVPRQGADLSISHPRAYDRTKEFLKSTLHAMGTRMKSHPEDYHPTILRNLGILTAAKELKTQFDMYWHRQHPFDVPVGKKMTLQWWNDLKDHPHARVLAVRATSPVYQVILRV